MNRYAPGGDIYVELVSRYGEAAAERVHQASLSGNNQAIAEALGEIKVGPARDDSTASLFFKQITTDPFAAPLASANRGIGTILGSAIKGIFSNPWVLLIVGAIVVIQFWPAIRPLLKRK